MQLPSFLTNLGHEMWNSDPQNFTPMAMANTYSVQNPVSPVNTTLYGDALHNGVASQVFPHDSSVPASGDSSAGDPAGVVPPSNTPDARGASSRSRPRNNFQYVEAELAKQYRMGRGTAYQEALANTAHQREVRDLQAAGLNPVLSAKFGGAGTFTPIDMGVTGAHGSGGSRASGNSGKDADQAFKVIGLLSGAVASAISRSSAVGNAVSNAVQAAGHLYEQYDWS